MAKTTYQTEQWAGQFGRGYTDRNPRSFQQVDDLYLRNYGTTRAQLNQEFLGGFDRTMRVLEVGANVGAQMQGLQMMGFLRVNGIELQSYAVELAQALTRNPNLIQATAFNIPYKDDTFDLVFTSGLLIHISPSDIGDALDEIHRCTRQYIWGMEYYHDSYMNIPYRGERDLLWKTDFARLYLDRFPGLRRIREERIKYLDGDNVDSMFLLEKTDV